MRRRILERVLASLLLAVGIVNVFDVGHTFIASTLIAVGIAIVLFATSELLARALGVGQA